MPEIKTKTCPNCKTKKSIDVFSKDKSNRDGLRAYCKKCVAEKRQIYLANNKEKISKKKKEFYIKNREKILLNFKKQYLQKRDENLLRSKLYAKKNREKILRN